MISAKVFSQLEFICRKLRDENLIFGGLQIVVSGDFKQLKPVANIKYRDPGEFCFTSNAWQEGITHIVVLEGVQRQDEPQLIQAIRELSDGSVTNATCLYLETLDRPLPPNLNPVYLYARNFDVTMKNYDLLHELQGQEKLYRATDNGDLTELKHIQIPTNLLLKVNSRVMLVTNLSHKLVNGTMGTVMITEDDHCVVRFDYIGHVSVKPQVFSVYSQEKQKDVATRTQIPLILAYAVTIHKAQGMTLQSLVIDARHATHPGQLATAVGRAVSSVGLRLMNFQKNSIPKQPIQVREFYEDAKEAVRETTMDLTCCRNNPFNAEDTLNDVQEDFPLGINPIVVVPEQDLMNADVRGNLMNDDWGSSLDLDTIVDGFTHDMDPQQQSNDVSESINLKMIRSEVQQEFYRMETEEQCKLYAKDTAILDEDLRIYLEYMWTTLKQHAASFNLTRNKSMVNRDFTRLISTFDDYRLSQENEGKLQLLLKRIPDGVDHRLIYKYTSKVIHKFLTTMAQTGETNTLEEQHEPNPSEASKAATRYLAGMCFAKASYKQCQIALHNVHKRREKQTVSLSRCKVELLQRHMVPQLQIQNDTHEPDTLALIIRKQNARYGLTHITDDVFNFFMLLDSVINKLLNEKSLTLLRSDIFSETTSNILLDENVQNAWDYLFWPSEHPTMFMRTFMEQTIMPYIHVKYNQFRKDMLDKIRENKSMEIRKTLWNKTRSSVQRKVRHEDQNTDKLTMEQNVSRHVTGNESSQTPKKKCMHSAETLSRCKKIELRSLCINYGIRTTSKTTKADMIYALRSTTESRQPSGHMYSLHQSLDQNSPQPGTSASSSHAPMP